MKKKSRKEVRKEFRKAKKIKKHEFFSKRKLRNEASCEVFQVKNERKTGNNFGKEETVDKKKKTKKEFKNPQEVMDFQRQKEKKEREKLEREIHDQRVKQLKADNLKEDVEIRKLEKQLKMKSGKSKAFAFDGLDYLLDVCDKRISKSAFDEMMENSDSEFENDLENIIGKRVKTKRESKKQNIKGSIINEEADVGVDDVDGEVEIPSEDEEVYTPSEGEVVDKPFEEEEEEADITSEEEEPSYKKDFSDNSSSELEQPLKKRKLEHHSESEEERTKEKPKLWEDIYGRTRDDKGNIVATYTPPHLRKKTEETDTEKQLRLKKQLKGLLNRLAERNMAFISNQIEQLYMSNSRNDMNETLCALFSEALFVDVTTPEKLIMEHAVLIAVLHANIGSEIGAHFLQFAVTEFSKLLKSESDIEDKRINNVLMFIMHLYNFQVFNSKLMYDIINELMNKLEEKEIELLLMMFRTVGFSLRKDDPFALKSFIIKVQEQVNAVQMGDNNSRVKFMLDMLMAIKNNNVTKISNYNPELGDRLKKNLKQLVRKGNYSSELHISLQDLLNAEKHGRWWIVGSAWAGAPSQTDSDKATQEGRESTEFSQKLLELAKKQRMNTDVRRNIFCILMSAEDFLEAFEKLVKLKLKGTVEREIMNVLLHCALQEKNFNPYYMYLANKFCTFDRKYQMMLQCAVWDRIKELKNTKPFQVTNLAKFVGQVTLEKGLPISMLKVIEFSDLDKPTMKFMRQVLLAILLSDDHHAIAAVFKRIADSPKLKMFRESLRLFLRHFVLKNASKNVDEEKAGRLADAGRLVEQILDSTDGSIVF